MKSFVKKIIKTVFVCVLMLVTLELAVRVLFKEYRSLNHGIGITGGVPFKLNSYGLRDYDFDIYKKTGEYRILCLGDSITFGTQNSLEDIYPKALERILNSEGKRAYRVINAGGVGGNTVYEYEYLLEKGIAFNPDFVILGLCLNDIGNSYYVKSKSNTGSPNFWKIREDFRIYRDMYKWNKKLPINENIIDRLNYFRWNLRAKSYLVSFIDVNITRFLYRTGIKKYSFDSYNVREQLLCFGIDENKDRAWNIVFEYLVNMRDFLKDRGIGFAVAVFPYEFQIDDSIKNNFFNIDKTAFTIDPQAKIRAFGLENDIVTVDLLPLFRQTKERLYFPLDYCHPNAVGHKIAAEGLYKVLKSRLN